MGETFSLQSYLEGGSYPKGTIHLDFTTHFLNHLFADAQSKSSSFVIHAFVKPRKIRKKFSKIFLLDSNPGIRYLNPKLNKFWLLLLRL